MAFTDIFKGNNLKALNYVLEKENSTLKEEIKQLKNAIAQKSHLINQLDLKVSEQTTLLQKVYPLSTFEKLRVPHSFETLQSQWIEWNPSIHETEFQLERQKRATGVLLSPINIDPEHGSGHFKGEESDYCTTLKNCECMDFQRRLLPCKHMYRLAYEFDVFMLDDVQYDPDVKNLLRLKDIRKLTAHLNSSKKSILYNIIADDGCVFEMDENIKSLIAHGLVQESVNTNAILNHFKRDTLYNLLSKYPDIKVAKSIKKSELVELITNNCPDIIANLETYMVFVEPHKNISHLLPDILRIL